MYLAFAASAFQTRLAYRGQVWAAVFGDLVVVFAKVAIWTSIFAGIGGVANGVTLAEMITYSILGAWDSDPSKGVISYLTPVARALSKHEVGDTVVLPGETGNKQVTIEKIEAYQA